ncbi:hypothetical protein EMIHUDRAFT_247841 [Emiliania huxleyi CCMP1516]|uniref:C-type lectin domain-containing protein n=2 Tax=Emiliania huxleyi TaxID=2903 RepID=A0A0D3IJU3_EMIH1|nr:hypothetical protein EMIHUDRAFT_247841 [Emiliania huxleyi CCMP1516]EOD11528.1 hypothetical protein EMIHUDRAFT_247841 [Emiliania huxleyi CCMP1516]|eukprot:XP_005763957.1 hypothetical protein EMIHUDRAFT_247841 [Emiliania huxleyi CCMP1516]
MLRAALALLCAALPGGIRAFAPSDCACAVVRPASGSLEGLCIAPLPPMEQEELDRICTCHAAPGAVSAWLGRVQETPIDCDAAADDALRRGLMRLKAPGSAHAVAAAAQGGPLPVFCSDSDEAIQAWAANHSTPVADDPYVTTGALQSSTTIKSELNPMDTPFVCHEEGDNFFLCHETPGAKLYPVVGAEGKFDVLCHPASALDDVAVLLQSNMLATGPSTAVEDSYCHALGNGTLVWTLAR